MNSYWIPVWTSIKQLKAQSPLWIVSVVFQESSFDFPRQWAFLPRKNTQVVHIFLIDFAVRSFNSMSSRRRLWRNVKSKISFNQMSSEQKLHNNQWLTEIKWFPCNGTMTMKTSWEQTPSQWLWANEHRHHRRHENGMEWGGKGQAETRQLWHPVHGATHNAIKPIIIESQI